MGFSSEGTGCRAPPQNPMCEFAQFRFTRWKENPWEAEKALIEKNWAGHQVAGRFYAAAFVVEAPGGHVDAALGFASSTRLVKPCGYNFGSSASRDLYDDVVLHPSLPQVVRAGARLGKLGGGFRKAGFDRGGRLPKGWALWPQG